MMTKDETIRFLRDELAYARDRLVSKPWAYDRATAALNTTTKS